MKSKTLLSQGIKALCKNDIDIEALISPRYEEIIKLLELYINEIELFNHAYGLVGTADHEELVIKHILDSITPLGIIQRLFPQKNKSGYHITDAGSGAGLPGIPLAITLPDCNFTLIERMGRRAGFLMNTKAVLSLSNITIEENDISKSKPGRFDLVTFRAFKPLEPKLLKTLINLCKTGGLIAAFKGKKEKIEEEMAFLSEYEQGTHINWEIIPYNVPFLDENRHILTIKQEFV